jgi:predicted ATPase/class 3 adenylate cyclase
VNFAQVLKEVVWCLVTEGSISYRRIKRGFDLDDAALEDLRRELIGTLRIAQDVGGELLAWAPAAGRPTLLDAGVAAALPLPAPPAAPAERRHLTVMFCDLADSTRLAARLDPEDLADVIRAYRDAVTAAVHRYDGFVAKFMGDGVLAYFGYPQAQEKDAELAVHAGLAILDALPALNGATAGGGETRLAVRIGIATGLVVVGESVGEGAAQEHIVVGETPNLAARLQSLASPDAILIGAATHDLVGDRFACEDLGAHVLKGIAEPVRVWRVDGLGAAADADIEAAAVQTPAAETAAVETAAADFPLVGRDEETGLLRRAWQQTKDERHGQVVYVSGEPGIGKSALVDTLRQAVRAEGLSRSTFHCSPYRTNSALYPAIEHWQRLAGWQSEDDGAARLAKLEAALAPSRLPQEETVPLLASLLAVPVGEDMPRLDLSPQQLKERTDDALVALSLEGAERRPLLQVWEDVHWADASTLDLLGQLIEQAPAVPLLIVLTFRPEFVPPWPARSHVRPLVLDRLERPQVEVLATRIAGGKALPPEIVEHIVQKTDGVPLFVEEMTKAVLGSGVLHADGERYTLTGPLFEVSIPASLQESLMARLDRLPKVREVAQLGAVLGRQFTYEMLHAIAAIDEPPLRDGLDRLVEAELLCQRGRPPRSRYIFKHVLIQDAAYRSLLRRTRQNYHRQAAELLEERFADTVETSPELVAHHYTEAGLPDRAVAYWHRAGERAALRSANQEAIGHLTAGLAQLLQLPDTEDRARRELPLQVLLGRASFATKGGVSLEATRAFSRARELCEAVGDDNSISPVLFGLWFAEAVTADYPRAGRSADQLLERAGRPQGRGDIMVAEVAVATTTLLLGSLTPARRHFDNAFASYGRYTEEKARRLAYEYGMEVGQAGHAHGAWCLWLLGYPNQALRLAGEALAISERMGHDYTRSRTLYWNSVLHALRREWATVDECGAAAVASAQERGQAMAGAAGHIMQGVARAMLRPGDDAVAEVEEALAEYRATGARCHGGLHLALLAQALAACGRYGEGLVFLREAAAFVEETGERYVEAEIHRLQGSLLLAEAGQDGLAAVEGCYRKALEVARAQRAYSLELRAACDLARLWAERRDRGWAAELLGPVYRWFTEGFDTADLKDAKALLDTLR